MKLSININGQEHSLELNRENGLSCKFDGHAFEADAAEVRPGVYSVLIGGRSFPVRVSRGGSDASLSSQSATSATAEYSVEIEGFRYAVTVRDPRRRSRSGGTAAKTVGRPQIKASMPGKVVRVLVTEGQTVERGQGLIVVEAMKMQNEIKSPRPGSVQKILVAEGQAVNAGDILLIVD